METLSTSVDTLGNKKVGSLKFSRCFSIKISSVHFGIEAKQIVVFWQNTRQFCENQREKAILKRKTEQVFLTS